MANELKGQILVDALCKGEAFLDNDLKPHWNTRPAAPVEGLKTVIVSGHELDDCCPVGTELVTRSQAEAIIAAERAEKDAWMKSAIDQQKQAKRLKEHNAVQMARIKELEETVRDLENLREGERETMKALEDKLEASEKALEASHGE